jgi:nucleotide-binding universal stress UspA family protein
MAAHHSSLGGEPAVVPRPAGFRSVLVCLDRSRAAEDALPLATYLAKADAARVILLHVLEPLPNATEVHATDALDCEIARQEARAYLEAVSKRVMGHGVRVECRIAEGHPAHGVAALAAKVDADLIVVSRFGEGGRDEWELGDTAQKILMLARGAVLVVPPDAHVPGPRVPPRKILVPLDGSLRAESVLPAALHLARPDGAELVLAHVVPDPVRTALLDTPADLALAHELADRLVARAEAYLDGICAELRRAGAQVAPVVARAVDHREGIVALAATHDIDLVVVAAHGAVCSPSRRFGSVAAHLIAHAHAPVLVIQDLPLRSVHDAAGAPAPLPSRSSHGIRART